MTTPTPRTIEGPDLDPTSQQAAYAAAELRAALKMLGHGQVTFYRDCSSLWPDQPSRDAIRERIAHLDTIAGQALPLLSDPVAPQADEREFCGRGPCAHFADHDGDCTP